MKIVFTDLDGTLLNDDKSICKKNLEMFKKLKEKGIVCVAATGRSLHLVNQVIPSDFPFDYVLFSSGAGIVDWKSKQLIYKQHLSEQEVKHISAVLLKKNISFMLQKEIPDNHYFTYFKGEKLSGDFLWRLKKYKNYSQAFNPCNGDLGEASQFLIILNPDINLINSLINQFKEYAVIRATSPLDGKSVWIEIFNKNVSKGLTAQWLCKRLRIETSQTMAVGNDYNDLDLLEFAHYSYMVENAPEELKTDFEIVAPNSENGVCEAIVHALKKHEQK